MQFQLVLYIFGKHRYFLAKDEGEEDRFMSPHEQNIKLILIKI